MILYCFFFLVKKNNNLDAYLKWNNIHNDFMVKLFFIFRIIPSIFFFFYNKVAYVLSHITFAISIIFSIISRCIYYISHILKYLGIVLKFVILILLYLSPKVYVYIKNNFLVFTKDVKTRKLFFINNLYNSFSSKILLSGTAFFSVYILIFVLLVIIILPFFYVAPKIIVVEHMDIKSFFDVYKDSVCSKKQMSTLYGELYSLFLNKNVNTLTLNNFNPDLFCLLLDTKTKEVELVNNILNTKAFLNFKQLVLVKLYFFPFLLLSLSLFILLNIIHSFLAFLSLCYDYLLKKLNSENFFVLFIISSTTLHIFFKLLSLILVL